MMPTPACATRFPSGTLTLRSLVNGALDLQKKKMQSFSNTGLSGAWPAHDVCNERSKVLFTYFDAKSNLRSLPKIVEVEKQNNLCFEQNLNYVMLSCVLVKKTFSFFSIYEISLIQLVDLQQTVFLISLKISVDQIGFRYSKSEKRLPQAALKNHRSPGRSSFSKF